MKVKNKLYWLKLVAKLAIISALIGFIVVGFKKCTSSEEKEWTLENHPLKIESIKKIAQLSLINFKDEVVVDSIVYYKNVNEQVVGNVSKIIDPSSWGYALRGSAIEKRLTLIVNGELNYGFDLKSDEFKVNVINDTAHVVVHAPKILSCVVIPSGTSVFLEHGDWKDTARKKLQKKAILKIEKHAQAMQFDERAKKQFEQLLQKLITNKHHLIVTYKK
ncbi:MAG: DUF4230 domain-containing protein [Crocinitomicaceae bacterium]